MAEKHFYASFSRQPMIDDGASGWGFMYALSPATISKSSIFQLDGQLDMQILFL